MADVLLSKVRKNYNPAILKDTLRNINLDIKDGDFIVFVGPSGCGKSTLLRMIAGLEDITDGDLKIDGKRVNDVPPSERNIGMVFQSYALYPHMTVFENMAFGLKLKHMDKKEIIRRVVQAADVLGLEAFLERKPKALSGGQRQRVAIGRCIVQNPSVFLFDEPLSNLDAKLRGEMRLELKKLHTTLDTTIIYVTHDQIEAMTLATKIVVLNKGYVQQVGTPYEIYNKPANVFVSKFVGTPQINLLECKLAKENGVPGITLHDHFMPLPDYEFSAPFEEGREVLFGIRPEHVTQFKQSEKSFEITARVVAYEKTGSETLVEFECNGATVRSKLDANVEIANGDDFKLFLALDNVSIFDFKTENRI